MCDCLSVFIPVPRSVFGPGVRGVVFSGFSVSFPSLFSLSCAVSPAAAASDS